MVAKKRTIKKESAVVSKGVSILRWLFTPDMSQGWKGWLGRAAGFLAVFVVFLVAVGIIGINVQLALAGLPPVPTATALAVLWESMLENLPAWIGAAAAIYAFGMFAMMPRRSLDRRGFVALLFFFAFWMSVAAAAAWCLSEYAKYSDWAWPFAVLVVIAVVGMIAALARFSVAAGANKLQTLLMFPFGYALFQYGALFTGAAEGNKSIALKSKWFPKLRDFLLDDMRGQAALAAIIVAMAVLGSAWELFLIAFFAVIYFWRGPKVIVAALPKLAWVAVGFNIAVAGFIAFLFGAAAIL
ncbi:MAG: hypothetical protein LBL46_01340 [Rickettsiales bacterium]|jgi:hypothetical protein|nr:hypothetical protein [Rickettsiales bacterium]